MQITSVPVRTTTVVVLCLLLLGSLSQPSFAKSYDFVQDGSNDILMTLITDGSDPFVFSNILGLSVTIAGHYWARQEGFDIGSNPLVTYPVDVGTIPGTNFLPYPTFDQVYSDGDGGLKGQFPQSLTVLTTVIPYTNVGHTNLPGLRLGFTDGFHGDEIRFRDLVARGLWRDPEFVPIGTGAYYWRGAVSNAWSEDAFAGILSNWISDSAGTSFQLHRPGPTCDVYFSSATAIREDTRLGTDVTIKSLTISGPSNVTINSSAGTSQTLTIAGAAGTGIDIQSGAGAVTIGANVAFSGGANTITVNNASAASISGAISGNNGLRLAGTSGFGYLVLSGTNNYTGGTTISEGNYVQVGNHGATGTLGSGPVTNNGAVLIARNNAYDISSSISGPGALYQYGSGTTILSAANTYTGATYVTSGVLQLNNVGALGDGTLNTAGVTVSSGGALDLNGITPTATSGLALNGTASSTVGALTNSSSAQAIYNRAVTLQSASSIGGNAGVMALIGPLNGAFPLTKVGSNKLYLVNDINETTTTTISAGTLEVGSGFSTGSLGSGEVINNASLVFDRNNDIVVGNLISGSGTVIAYSYYGTGRAILTNANTYTGGTIVNAGRLLVNNTSGSGTGTGAVTVNSGGTLGGTLRR